MGKKDYELLFLEEIVDRLQGKRLYVIAEHVGLSYPTVLDIATSKKKNPKYDTVNALSRYFGETYTIE